MRDDCPLCGMESGGVWYLSPHSESYFRCGECTLAWRARDERLGASAERARYELHENNPNDAEYVRFLRRLADPVIERLPASARGLDFGSGPTPVLAELLSSAGFPCVSYDPFFAANDALLDARYEFVTCCEVIEHVYRPAEVFALFQRLLRPGAVAGLMTRFYPDDDSFADWWYRRDPTHVCFYTESTMRWIGDRHGWRTEFPAPNVTLFTRPA